MRTKILTTVTLTLLAAVLSAAPASGQSSDPRPPTGGAEDVTGVTPLVDVVAVTTGGDHSCALLESRQLRCWGSNVDGQLGNGAPALTPTGVVTVLNPAGTGPLVGVTAVTAGEDHTCALLTNQEVRCWGYGGDGALGHGDRESTRRPVPVLAVTGTGRLDGVTQISAGSYGTCARLANGQARCWGHNNEGQLGEGSTTRRTRPVAVRAVSGPGPLTDVTRIESGVASTCARLGTGQARCWGANTAGQLGDGSTSDRHRPVVVKNVAGGGPLTGVRRVSAGDAHACAVLTNGTARCWGANGDGQLGDGTPTERHLPGVVVGPTGTGPLTGIDHLDAASGHSCARLTNGQVRCWGENHDGQVGNGTLGGTDLLVPTPVRNHAGTADLAGVTQLQTSRFHTCVRLGNGQARCWGYGENGALGDGDIENRPLPAIVVTT